MAARGGEFPMFNPTVGITENTKLDRLVTNSYLVSQSGVAATDFIDAGTTGNFVYFNPPDTTIAPSGSCGSLLQFDDADDSRQFADWWNCAMGGVEKSVGLDANKRFIRLNLSMEKMSGAYAYNSTTGQVYYAGVNTPYYGKTNING